ncbi:MAG: ABC transporter permease subunit [Saprospiraceae bacterium]|jgi:Cu-processing system permease protein|nr:ABC transporter permease subunit [Saprospiraceae bacterium]MBP6237290.1 ABC transporter permease subunit [Saprospiraceae bacterium]MBP6568912.1 ABC transporter permease subunit [Saprospiraceae bacterium]
MKKITGFVITDILKNKIILFYTLILAVFSWSVFSLEDNTAKGVLSLLNVILLTVPLVSIIFSNIYMYNSSEFIELLVSQPIQRKTIWSSLFTGLVIAMNMAYLLGVGIPVLIFVPDMTGLIIILTGMMISTIFISIAVLCSILTRDKARGIGFAIITWLFLTLIYDGLVLFLMFQFSDYPIEKPMVIVSALNPIDLARIMVLLQVDVSALMGYTGAIFKQIFGTSLGLIVSFGLMMLWIIIPFLISLKKFKNKDL